MNCNRLISFSSGKIQVKAERRFHYCVKLVKILSRFDRTSHKVLHHFIVCIFPLFLSARILAVYTGIASVCIMFISACLLGEHSMPEIISLQIVWFKLLIYNA